VPAPFGYRSCLHNVGILSRQFEGTESEKPNGHQSGNMGEKTEDRYIKVQSENPPTHFAGIKSRFMQVLHQMSKSCT
jgi:hypothetical protein